MVFGTQNFGSSDFWVTNIYFWVPKHYEFSACGPSGVLIANTSKAWAVLQN